jgi:LmbE family N-acetylglucosaminyl deacetylase
MAVAIISPHLDDAALSCWHLIEQPDSSVVTVFAGVPEPGTTTSWDRMCGEPDSVALMQSRVVENAQALSSTGTKIVNLPYLDCQYQSDARDIEDIAASVLAVTCDGVELFLPIGVGRSGKQHTDHLSVMRLAKSLMDRGRVVSFYADIPYALSLTRLSRWPTKLSVGLIEQALGIKLELSVHELSPEQRTRKKTALKAYKTQFGLINILNLGALSRKATYRYEVTFKQI